MLLIFHLFANGNWEGRKCYFWRCAKYAEAYRASLSVPCFTIRNQNWSRRNEENGSEYVGARAMCSGGGFTQTKEVLIVKNVGKTANEGTQTSRARISVIQFHNRVLDSCSHSSGVRHWAGAPLISSFLEGKRIWDEELYTPTVYRSCRVWGMVESFFAAIRLLAAQRRCLAALRRNLEIIFYSC